MRSNSKTKIVLMGGNLIGCSCLRYLFRLKNTKILLVVGCYNDNGSIIEPKVWNVSLARLTLNKGLPFVQPKSTRNIQFINDIQKIDRPDYIITAWYDKILDPEILKGNALRFPQNDKEATYHAAGYPHQRIIDWNRKSENIDRFIRALTFPGFEAARTFYNDLEINIMQPVEKQLNSNGDIHYEPGTILDIEPPGMSIKTADGKLLIKKIRINKSMPIDAYKLSKLFTLKTGDKFKSYENLHSEGKLNLIVP